MADAIGKNDGQPRRKRGGT